MSNQAGKGDKARSNWGKKFWSRYEDIDFRTPEQKALNKQKKNESRTTKRIRKISGSDGKSS